MIVSKRVYEPSAPSDGYRVLIDRLWPRGVSKAKAHLDAWEKDVAPSAELRKWYEHDPSKWPEFQKRYKQELKTAAAQTVLDDLVRRAKRGRVTLLYSSSAAEISDVVVLEGLLNRFLTRAKSVMHVKRAANVRRAKRGRPIRRGTTARANDEGPRGGRP